MATPVYYQDGDTRYFQLDETLTTETVGTHLIANGALVHTQVAISTALTATASAIINLQGSLDNINFYNIGSMTVTGDEVNHVCASEAVKYVRNKITTINTTGALSIVFQNYGAH